jgi:hypothetical protein
MAVPQIFGLISSSPGNTIGYQPTLQNGLPINPPAIIFQYEGEQTVTLDSDITDHWTENNSTIQDQIALHPEAISTHGFVGELTDAPPNALLAALQIAANTLTIIPGLAPQFTLAAIEQYNAALYAYQVAQNATNALVSAFSTVSGSGEAVIGSNGISNASGFNGVGKNTIASSQGKQQIYFQQFYGYRANRVLFTIQTPWAVFQNCAIKSLRAIQDAETKMVTDFEVTFKTIRFASTTTTGSQFAANPNSRLAGQLAASSPVNNGNVNAANAAAQPTPPNGVLQHFQPNA